jgi:hypothetical protein
MITHHLPGIESLGCPFIAVTASLQQTDTPISCV